jgi:two-component system sensor histidine kinase/response regulator
MSDRLQGHDAWNLSSLFESTSDAIVAVDDAQRIVLFNRAACETFGWGRSEVLGRPISMLLPPAARAAHEARVEAFAAESHTWRRMRVRPRRTGQRKDGTQFPAEVTISKVLMNGRWRLAAIVREVSKRHVLKEQL